MSGESNNFRAALLRNSLLLTVFPILAMAAAAWAVLWEAQTRTELTISTRAASVLADRLGDRISAAGIFLENARDEILRQGIAVRPALAFCVGSSRSFSAVLQLDAHGTVEYVAVRPDLKIGEQELLSLDLSALTSLTGTAEHALAIVPEAPPLLSNSPEIALVVSLRDGRSLLAFCDTAALLQDIERAQPASARYLVVSAKRQIIAESSGLSTSVQGQLLRTSPPPVGVDDAVGGFARVTGPLPGWSVWYQAESSGAVNWGALRLLSIAVGLLLAAVTSTIALVQARLLTRPFGALAREARTAIELGDMSKLPRQSYVEGEIVATALRDVFVRLQQERSDRAALASAVKVASGAAPTPDAVYGNVASALASITGARCVLIAEWLTGTKTRARVLGAKSVVPLPSDYTYELTSHPASLLSGAQPVSIYSQVSRQWPESPLLRLTGAEGYIAIPLIAYDGSVAGHIEIIDDHDLTLSDELRAIGAAMATRAMGILEQVRAQARMRENEELYSAITLDQQDLFCRWTADAAITHINDAWCQFLGKQREHLIGRSLLPLLHEEDREALRSAWGELSALRPVQAQDMRLLDAHHQPVWHRMSVRVLLDNKGRVIQYQGTARDISRLRELIASVTDIRSRFDILAGNTATAFWIVDWQTQRCVYANAAFQRLWGTSAEAAAMSSLAWTAAIHEDDRANVVRNYVLHAIDGGYSETYRVVRSDGTIVRIREQAFPMRNSEGQLDRIAHIAFEITVEPTTASQNPAA